MTFPFGIFRISALLAIFLLHMPHAQTQDTLSAQTAPEPDSSSISADPAGASSATALPADTADADSSITASNQYPADTAGTASAKKADITDTTSLPAANDSIPADSTLPAPAHTLPADTARFYDQPFLSLGTGWTLGSMPLFDEWQKALPDSVGAMPGFDTLTIQGNVTAEGREDPDAYNTAFPLQAAFTPFINKERQISITASMWWMSKRYHVFWLSDTDGGIWYLSRELSILSAALGGAYYYRIPPEYFTIANIDRAFLMLGTDVAPYVKITSKISDQYDVTATQYNNETSLRGYGISWYAGIATFRTLTDRAGIEVGALYNGSWTGRYIKNDHHVRWSAINPLSGDDEVLSFMTHRFKIYFNICIGKKAPKPQTDTAEPAPANSSDAAKAEQSETPAENVE